MTKDIIFSEIKRILPDYDTISNKNDLFKLSNGIIELTFYTYSKNDSYDSLWYLTYYSCGMENDIMIPNIFYKEFLENDLLEHITKLSNAHKMVSDVYNDYRKIKDLTGNRNDFTSRYRDIKINTILD